MRSTALVWLAVAIPLTSPDGWQELKFKKIPANQIQFAKDGLKVTVNKSSSPLIYPLKEELSVSGFKAKLKIDGEMNPVTAKFPEDAYLRLGFVAPGSRRMSMMEKMVAPEWLKRLFSLAPKDTGVDKIYFYNVVAQGQGQAREFPGSKGLMHENLIRERQKGETELVFSADFPKPVSTVALWLSIDGDDSKSTYTLTISSLELNGEPLKQPRLEKSE